MKPISKLISSIPLILIGYALIKLNFTGGDNYGGGMPEAIITLLGIMMYGIILVIILIWNAVGHYKYKKSFNIIPLTTTSILIVLFLLAGNWSNIFSHKTILYAKNNAHNNIYYVNKSIALKEKNRFELTLHSIEYTWIYRGTYTLSHDTITFQRDVFGLTDSTVSNKYLLDSSKRFLYPIVSGKISSDSTQYFEIHNDSKD